MSYEVWLAEDLRLQELGFSTPVEIIGLRNEGTPYFIPWDFIEAGKIKQDTFQGPFSFKEGLDQSGEPIVYGAGMVPYIPSLGGGAMVLGAIGTMGLIGKGIALAWKYKWWLAGGLAIWDAMGDWLQDEDEETEREVKGFLQSIQDGLRDGSILNGLDKDGNPNRYIVIDTQSGRIWATRSYFSKNYVKATKKGVKQYMKDKAQSKLISQLSERGSS